MQSSASPRPRKGDSILAINQLSIALPPSADRSHAVHDITFTARAGETICLVGESGSGKSVIAQTVMGLPSQGLRIDGGTIGLLGEELVGASTKRLRELRGSSMAMVFQEPMTALNPVMRCGEQVDEMLKQHTSMTRQQRHARILAMFERVHLPDPARIYASYPHQLSGGQRQRIVIAIALILRPALLICDEPTTALDVTTQSGILSLVKEMQEENGTAVVFITHDFGVVADIADEIVVLRLGQQMEKGTRDNVLSSPKSDYTRGLLAAVPGLVPATRTANCGAPTLLDARGVHKTYVTGSWPARKRRVNAVQDVSLTLHGRETIGIVGESGSGKSTVARCLAQLIEPTTGTIHADGIAVGGKSRREQSAFRRTVQVIFQDPYRSLNPRQTVGASIIEGPVNFGVPKGQAWDRARKLMELVRLRPDSLSRYPSEFSGGQRQRICIARALACEPKVLIADEAVSALDVSVQAQVLELLDDIQDRLGIGIVFITHDLRVASQICDRIIVMRQGQVVESGTASGIFANPQHPYTKSLIAAAPGRTYRFTGTSEASAKLATA
ncbi:dipeptide ABC transporter ATP-binding protein [Cupriavidus basilensis]